MEKTINQASVLVQEILIESITSLIITSSTTILITTLTLPKKIKIVKSGLKSRIMLSVLWVELMVYQDSWVLFKSDCLKGRKKAIILLMWEALMISRMTKRKLNTMYNKVIKKMRKSNTKLLMVSKEKRKEDPKRNLLMI